MEKLDLRSHCEFYKWENTARKGVQDLLRTAIMKNDSEKLPPKQVRTEEQCEVLEQVNRSVSVPTVEARIMVPKLGNNLVRSGDSDSSDSCPTYSSPESEENDAPLEMSENIDILQDPVLWDFESDDLIPPVTEVCIQDNGEDGVAEPNSPLAVDGELEIPSQRGRSDVCAATVLLQKIPFSSAESTSPMMLEKNSTSKEGTSKLQSVTVGQKRRGRPAKKKKVTKKKVTAKKTSPGVECEMNREVTKENVFCKMHGTGLESLIPMSDHDISSYVKCGQYLERVTCDGKCGLSVKELFARKIHGFYCTDGFRAFNQGEVTDVCECWLCIPCKISLEEGLGRGGRTRRSVTKWAAV